MNQLLLDAYLKSVSFLSKSPLLSVAGVDEARLKAFQNEEWRSLPAAYARSIHFHAASVGELEIITPIIEVFAAKKIPLVLSIFSSSAFSSLQKLATQLKQSGAEVLYSGFSPREENWESFLSKFNVMKSVGSKYEAWPGLWVALSKMNIPLIMIQSRNSSSLNFAKKMLNQFDVPLPKIYFFGVEDLSAHFNQSEFKYFEDPRWVRISRRASTSHPRVKELQRIFSDSLRPYGVLGSAWMEDLELFLPTLLGYHGTIFIVPHHLGADTLQKMEESILRNVTKEHYARTSQIPDGAPQESSKRFVLVDEMGILLELYSLADWAYVGGGFHQGVHSTMEPAYYGIPVACGPKNSEKFPEIYDLIQRGQLTLCQNADDFRGFLQAGARRGKSESDIAEVKRKTENFDLLTEEILRI